MMNGIETKTYRIAVIQVPLKLLLQVPVAYLRKNIKIIRTETNGNIVIIITENERRVGEKLPVVNMVPAQCAGGIAPVETKEVAYTQLVFSKITR